MLGTVQDSTEFRGEKDTLLAVAGVYDPVMVEFESIA